MCPVIRHSLAVLVFLLAFGAAALAEPLRIVVISDLNGSYGSITYDGRIDRAVRSISVPFGKTPPTSKC